MTKQTFKKITIILLCVTTCFMLSGCAVRAARKIIDDNSNNSSSSSSTSAPSSQTNDTI